MDDGTPILENILCPINFYKVICRCHVSMSNVCTGQGLIIQLRIYVHMKIFSYGCGSNMLQQWIPQELELKLWFGWVRHFDLL